MSTYTELFSFLTAQSAITALVDDRIYPITIPQLVAFPCIRILRDEDGGFLDADGQGDTIRTEVDIDCFAESADEAVEIADAVAVALKNYKGLLDTRLILDVSLDATRDDFEEKLQGGKFRSSQAWTIYHR